MKTDKTIHRYESATASTRTIDITEYASAIGDKILLQIPLLTMPNMFDPYAVDQLSSQFGKLAAQRMVDAAYDAIANEADIAFVTNLIQSAKEF